MLFVIVASMAAWIDTEKTQGMADLNKTIKKSYRECSAPYMYTNTMAANIQYWRLAMQVGFPDDYP
jgi:hypothetical protein